MERILSFCVDHTKLKPGLYTSRIDGDTVTYDLRMCVPNGGKYLENAAVHSFEHLFATYVRNSRFSDKIIYVGPMGCLTGFYFVVRDSISKEEVLDLLKDTMKFIKEYSGDIPGVSEPECGNYRMHSLDGAKKIAVEYLEVLNDWNVEKFKYN